ncbi:SPOSA6832_01697 [Sporobolomyces salmonicolor]|uniref:SPOSA6832_01697-mRNA-1:cds n=1 Tax=Sporidiobolus salmonicolor TaxID=5005 RepID=A0A0D6EJJ7_SPOSA|nr:SPOSA6832_01697 [Sporobolomyces salmonicolor]
MEGELAQVVQALQTLYSPLTPPAVQSTLQAQLQSVQLSPLGWTLVGPLLSYPDSSVRFFAASTLQQKLSRQWDSLAEGDYDGLKNSTLGWLASSAAAAYPANGGPGTPGEKPVLRKLAAATTGLSLRLPKWDEWLLEAVMRVAASGAGREATLEVLSIAIEQVGRAELPANKRHVDRLLCFFAAGLTTVMAYMASLASSIPHLVTTLSSSLSPSSSASEINLALSCFVAYLNAGQLSHPELTTLYPLLASHLASLSTVIAACSAIEELIERSSGLSGSAGVTRFMNRQRTHDLVVGWATGPFVHSLMQQAIADASEGGEPDDEAMAVFKLLCTLSEHFISSFLFQSPPASSGSSALAPSLSLTSPATHQLLTLLLALTTFPGYSPDASYMINELPTGCWMALQELGADEGLVFGEGDGREGRHGREAEWDVYKGVFSALATGLRERAIRPREEEFGTWPKDIKDAFRVYRTTVLVDPIQYAYYVLRDSLLAGLVELAAQQVAQPPEPGRDSYEALEATLFTLYSLAECVPISSPPSLSSSVSSATSTSLSPTSTYLSALFSPSILGRLPSLPSQHPSLRSTALRLVGAYSTWFSSAPEACLQAVTFVVNGLQEPELVPQAARALRGLCDANRKVLVGHVGDFVGVLARLERKVEDSELVKVLESVASVVQALPEEQVVEPLLTLANPLVSKLSSAVHGQAHSPAEARELCLQQLSYLTALSKGLSNPESDLVDLDASFDDSQLVKDTAGRVLQDPRISEMRNRLGQAVEGAARVWAGDVEVVTVELPPPTSSQLEALSDYIRHSTSDSIPSPLGIDPLLLLSLCSAALQVSPSSVWLGIAGSLLARLAREHSDRELRDEELVSVGRPVEGMLNVVLSTHGDLAAKSRPSLLVLLRSMLTDFVAQIVRHYPRIFTALPSHYLDAVLAFAERGLGMQEQFSLKSTIELLLSSVQQTKMASASSATFHATLLPRTRSILRAVLLAVAGGVPRSHLTSLSELLHACLLRLPEQARPALKELLATPGWPSERTGEDAKGKFERAVLSARTGRQVRQAVSDFALLARGLDGSAYGAATS